MRIKNLFHKNVISFHKNAGIHPSNKVHHSELNKAKENRRTVKILRIGFRSFMLSEQAAELFSFYAQSVIRRRQFPYALYTNLRSLSVYSN